MLVLLFLSPLASSISTQRKHLWYFNGAEDRIIWDVNHSSGQRNTFVSTPSSTNLEVDLSFEASWNVFNGLLPGCLEKSSMSSLGGFLLLPIFINGQRRDPSFAIKAQGQRYIVYVHWTWAHCTTSLAYQVQLERQKWPKMTIKGQTETYWLHYSLCYSAWLFIFEIIWQLILIGQLQL